MSASTLHEAASRQSLPSAGMFEAQARKTRREALEQLKRADKTLAALRTASELARGAGLPRPDVESVSIDPTGVRVTWDLLHVYTHKSREWTRAAEVTLRVDLDGYCRWTWRLYGRGALETVWGPVPQTVGTFREERFRITGGPPRKTPPDLVAFVAKHRHLLGSVAAQVKAAAKKRP